MKSIKKYSHRVIENTEEIPLFQRGIQGDYSRIPSTVSRLPFTAASLLCCFFLLTFYLLPSTFYRLYASQLTVHFLDVGQGDSTLFQFPNGTTMLIDGGPADNFYDAGRETIIPYLDTLGIKKIDAVVMTHPHRDHIGGLVSVFMTMPVSTVYDPGFAYPSPIYERCLRLIGEEKIKYVKSSPQMKIKLDPNVEITVLSPPKNLPWDDANNNSIVLKIQYKKINEPYCL